MKKKSIAIRILAEPEVIIEEEGEVSIIFSYPVELDLSDKEKTEKQIENLVQGKPQYFPLTGAQMAICGVGLLESYAYNPVATEIAHAAKAIHPAETITGDVLIMPVDSEKLSSSIQDCIKEMCSLMAQLIANEGGFFEIDFEKIQ